MRSSGGVVNLLISWENHLPDWHVIPSDKYELSRSLLPVSGATDGLDDNHVI